MSYHGLSISLLRNLYYTAIINKFTQTNILNTSIPFRYLSNAAAFEFKVKQKAPLQLQVKHHQTQNHDLPSVRPESRHVGSEPIWVKDTHRVADPIGQRVKVSDHCVVDDVSFYSTETLGYL